MIGLNAICLTVITMYLLIDMNLVLLLQIVVSLKDSP